MRLGSPLDKYRSLLRVVFITLLTLGTVSAWITVVDPTNPQAVQTFPSYDFEGFEEPKYDLIGVILPVVVQGACVASLAPPPWPTARNATLAGAQANGTILLVDRNSVDGSGCVSYGPVFDGLRKILPQLKTAGYPAVQLIILGATLNSGENFGNSKDEDFHEFQSARPLNVHLALVGRDTAAALWQRTRTAGPLAARVQQDPGYWNRYRASALETIHTVFRYVLVSDKLIKARPAVNHANQPSKTRFEETIRYLSWVALYTCYFWMMIKWIGIIRKIQSPRLASTFYYYTLAVCAFTYFYCALNLVLVIYPSVVMNLIKRVTINYVWPPLFAIQGIGLFVYGFIFLQYIFRGFVFDGLKSALAKLTRLCYGSFLSLSLISFCSALNNPKWTSIPWVVVARAGTQNLASFILTCLIIWALRVHDSPELTPVTMSKVDGSVLPTTSTVSHSIVNGPQAKPTGPVIPASAVVNPSVTGPPLAGLSPAPPRRQFEIRIMGTRASLRPLPSPRPTSEAPAPARPSSTT
ncbi:hypothetical protein IWQ60_001650 [Tieghemiomyces parasiticus]|uniref:Transmembrane protein n=1 Tax=Tieghemiomyces parasiticus TaxID=78921 RepID=A0A9W8ACR4_9FUNG|nr:hypothetical protein IWQ60_001650 [Tieghemiomyces parasiticus]